jgi:hypothetical protein
VILGVENTKFFHTFATRSYRKNFVYSLKIDDSTIVTDHELKVVSFSMLLKMIG